MNSKPVVAVVVGDRPVPGLAEIEKVAEVRVTDIAGLGGVLPGAQVLFLWDYFADGVQKAWPQAGALEWVHVPAAGVEKLLFPELVESGVVLTNARGVFDQPMAEHVLGTVLYFAKQFNTAKAQQGRREWNKYVPGNIAGRSVLVAGTGSIGRCIGRLLAAAGMTVDGLGRTARPGDADFRTIHASADFTAVAGDYDYVVLAAPLTPQTRHMVDADVLAALKSTAVLINVGRGALVDEEALVAALETGAIAGAGLDVFETEPLPADSPLWARDNVLATPHVSGDARSQEAVLVEQFTANLHAWLQGRPLLNVVDKALGFVPPSEPATR